MQSCAIDLRTCSFSNFLQWLHLNNLAKKLSVKLAKNGRTNIWSVKVGVHHNINHIQGGIEWVLRKRTGGKKCQEKELALQNSACRWPRVGNAWAFKTLCETLEGPGPMSSFSGTWIGFLRISGGETSISVKVDNFEDLDLENAMLW